MLGIFATAVFRERLTRLADRQQRLYYYSTLSIIVVVLKNTDLGVVLHQARPVMVGLEGTDMACACPAYVPQ